jgi:hypothetical protein
VGHRHRALTAIRVTAAIDPEFQATAYSTSACFAGTAGTVVGHVVATGDGTAVGCAVDAVVTEFVMEDRGLASVGGVAFRFGARYAVVDTPAIPGRIGTPLVSYTEVLRARDTVVTN